MRNQSVVILLVVLLLPIAAILALRYFGGRPIPISYNLRSIRMRARLTVLTIAGIGLVVMVFLVLLSMLQGFMTALRSTGSRDNAIVIQRGSPAEVTSALTREQVQVLSQAPQIERDARGLPLASPERILMASVPRRSDGVSITVSFRGVTESAFNVRQHIEVVEGRLFQAGRNEIIVGRRLLSRTRGIKVGGQIRIAQRDWAVVGVFAAGGSAFESELWGDAEVLGAVFHREENFQSLTVRLRAPSELDRFADGAQRDPRLQVQIASELSYYEDLAGPTAKMLRILAVFVAFILGIGAIFGAMNTMHGLIVVRTREIGTLRALGFTRRSVTQSMLLESVAIALAGGIVGCLAVLPINGLSASTGQTASFSEIAFAFQVSPVLILIGLGLSSFLGAIGGLIPAFRAARQPLSSALRAHT